MITIIPLENLATLEKVKQEPIDLEDPVLADSDDYWRKVSLTKQCRKKVEIMQPRSLGSRHGQKEVVKVEANYVQDLKNNLQLGQMKRDLVLTRLWKKVGGIQ